MAAAPAAAGEPDEEELEQLIYGCDTIQEASILLDLPQAAAVTAQTLFHRFHARVSPRERNVRHSATGALFLAAKAEECPRRMRHVLSVFNALFLHREGGRAAVEPLDIHSERYGRMKALLARLEGEILAALGFLLHTEPPHKFILNYVKLLCDDPDLERRLAQSAWNTLNDSLRLPLCLRHSPETLCCAAISMAARTLGLPLPTDPPWWEVFEADKAAMEAVCSAMVDLYRRPKAQYKQLRPREADAGGEDGPRAKAAKVAPPVEGRAGTPPQAASPERLRTGPVGVADGPGSGTEPSDPHPR